MRDLTRSSKSILDYDYVDIEDKKQKVYKGVFVPNRYADRVKEFLDEIIKNESMENFEKLKSFSSNFTGTTENRDFKELKAERWK
jgi:hypothetical protein